MSGITGKEAIKGLLRGEWGIGMIEDQLIWSGNPVKLLDNTDEACHDDPMTTNTENLSVGERVGPDTIIASSESMMEDGWVLVVLLTERASRRYIVQWMQPGTDDGGVIGYRVRWVAAEPTFLEAAHAYDNAIATDTSKFSPATV